jgi:heme ABC exporter ATP-binding subunit CcmA
MVPSPEARASSLPGHGDHEPSSAAMAAGISDHPVIVLENLVKFFGRFAALRDISASFVPGRLYVVVGDNGAGKSTLLRVIAGLTQPSQGSVRVLGSQTTHEVARRIGYMGHAPLLYDELDCRENLRYFAGLYGLHNDAICRDAMRRVGLDPDLQRRVGQYSQGMRQRLSLARAVLHDPELILLDEPFSNVDVRSVSDMAAILGTVRDRGKTILLVTHQSALMEPVADEFVHMSAGKIESRRSVRPLPVTLNMSAGAR